jgi:hypothetical protein
MGDIFRTTRIKQEEEAELRDPFLTKDKKPAPPAKGASAPGTMSQADFAYGKQTDEQKAKSAKKLADLLRARGD